MSHAFYRTAQGRLPKPMSSKGMTTFFFRKPGKRYDDILFLIPKIYSSYDKIKLYARPKITYKTSWGGGWFNRELKIFILFLSLISFSNLIFSNNTFALFTPTLSASIDNTAASVNGNQVINSTNKTTEIPLNLTVNTNNKTGYTATLNSETDETALVNNDSITNTKIDSISSAGPLVGFSNNTWGVKIGTSANFLPIPKLTTPMNAIQTTSKTSGNEMNSIKIGLKLSDNLESGRYTNKLIFSILTNNYNRIAIMTEGPDFNKKLKALETSTNKIEHFKKSTVAPAASMNAKNIEDEESDYEIKLWLDSTNKTAYYYAEPEKVYLNINSTRMFYSSSDEQKIKNILEIGLSGFDTSQVMFMGSMFHGMSNLTSLNLSNFDTSRVTNMRYMFTRMYNLTTLNLSSFDTSKVTDMSGMFSNMRNLTSLNLTNFNTSKVTDMGFMFYGMFNLTSLNLSSFDTSKVTNMRDMFSGMSSLATLNLSNFNTSKVTDMSGMFDDMRNLTSLNLTNFNTSKVTNMSGMFDGMRSLTSLNLSNFNTSKVTNMNYMFNDMYNLTSLNLSNFDTSKVTDMSQMFSGMHSLTSLNLSNFDTSKVTSMIFMFASMYNLTTLDLSNFDTSQVTDMGGMLTLADGDMSNDKLEKIYVNNDFNTAKLTNFSGMFTNRKKLRGGNGSYLADPSTADKTWLRVDRPGVQGYFTRKP